MTSREDRRRSGKVPRKAAAVSSAALLAATGAGAAVVLTGGVAQANPVLTVNTLVDAGPGSLRQAILDANSTPGQDRIEFSVTGDMALSGDLPPITDGVAIVGPGAGSLRIDGVGLYRAFVCNFVSTGSVSIEGLTVQYTDGPGFTSYGATVPVSLSNVVLSHNSFGNAGGIMLYHNLTDVTISDVTVSHNSSGINAGGLYANSNVAGQHITITGSRFTDNRTEGSGGAIYARRSSLAVSDSTFEGNEASQGGGIALTEMFDATFDGVTIAGNEALNGGGIISVSSDAVITGSTIRDNHGYFGGGVFNLYGTMVVDASTVSGNEAEWLCGGLLGDYGALTIENSTVSGNSSAQGGAIVIAHGSGLTLSSSTVTANTASAVEGVDGILLLGVAAGPIGSRGSIVAGNGAIDLGTGAPVPLTVTTDHSIFGTVVTPDVTLNDLGGTVTGVTAEQLLLGPLADNGGPTLTHALLPGSVAIDAGGTTVGPFAGSEWDQRGVGYVRIVNGVADAGAYEVQPPPPEPPPEPTFTG